MIKLFLYKLGDNILVISLKYITFGGHGIRVFDNTKFK